MKEEYITNSLSKILFPYELDPEPSLTEIKELILLEKKLTWNLKEEYFYKLLIFYGDLTYNILNN